MPASQYGKYTIISRPRLDKNRDVWLPYSCIAADGDGRNYYYRQFMDLNTTFKTEEQALTDGFIVARAWIDEPYNTPGGEKKAESDTLISAIVTLQTVVNDSRKLVLELSDALEHSRRLIDEISSIIAKLKVKRLFEDAS